MKRFFSSAVKNKELNRFSRIITQTKGKRGNAEAMMWALPQYSKKEDFSKPIIGVGAVRFASNPCNSKLDVLSCRTIESITEENMIGFDFNTIGVSDGITMGTPSMRMSLPSREVIADSMEVQVVGGNYDGFVGIAGCDKNIPATMMAMCELNRPSLMVYGGAMPPSYLPRDVKAGDFSHRLDIVSAFEASGKFAKGIIDEEEKQEIIQNSCHRDCGACSGMYTANTMASIAEVMGFTLPNSATNPSISKEKFAECQLVGPTIMSMLENDIKPSDWLTKESFDNAIVFLNIMGGSTNAVIHLLAVARAANIDITLDDFIKLQHIPVLADMKPHGRYVMNDLHKFGGMGPLVNYLIDNNLLNGDCMMATGKTLAESYGNMKNDKKPFFHDIIRPLNERFKGSSHIRVLSGNIAPEGCISKIYNENIHYTGSALIFDNEEDMISALERHEITKDHFIVIRYQGESIGCPEMLIPTSALVGYFGDCEDIPPLATDGRFSGGSKGVLIAHLPDAYKSKITHSLRNGDEIKIDLISNNISVSRDGIPLTIDGNDESVELKNPIDEQTTYLQKYNKLVNGLEDGYTTKILHF